MGDLTVISGKFIGCTVIRWRAMALCKQCSVPCSLALPSLWTGGAGEGAGAICQQFVMVFGSEHLLPFTSSLQSCYKMHD